MFVVAPRETGDLEIVTDVLACERTVLRVGGGGSLGIGYLGNHRVNRTSMEISEGTQNTSGICCASWPKASHKKS